MKILIIDRDPLSSQLVKTRLHAMGHSVVEEPVKNNAIARLEREDFDAVFFDPAPLNNARPVVLSIRRAVKNYPYIILMSQDLDRAEALKNGANDLLSKPLDGSELELMVANAQRLSSLVRRMGDESEDFPSAGGVIAKSAFNQLFLSAMDRADRYGERSYMVFIEINNYNDILAVDGRYAAEYAVARLSQYLVRLRRQSDIIAQTGRGEFCLLLQRPIYETEPREAANRFGEAMSNFTDVVPSDNATIDIHVRLVDIPVGQVHVDHRVSLNKSQAATAR
jgi:CheY-like chemotaxis protein